MPPIVIFRLNTHSDVAIEVKVNIIGSERGEEWRVVYVIREANLQGQHIQSPCISQSWLAEYG